MIIKIPKLEMLEMRKRKPSPYELQIKRTYNDVYRYHWVLFRDNIEVKTGNTDTKIFSLLNGIDAKRADIKYEKTKDANHVVFHKKI